MIADTHVVLWFVDGDRRLGPQTRLRIETEWPVFYSAISAFELRIKHMSRGGLFPDSVVAAFDEAGFRRLPFAAEHAERVLDFPELVDHDPFDRAIVAQAKAYGLQLLTADRVLLGLGEPWIVDARQ